MNGKKLLCVCFVSVLTFGGLAGCESEDEAANAPLPREVGERAEREAEGSAPASSQEASVAKDLFEKHCAACHPNGGNIMNSEKTLATESLAESGIKTPRDIVQVLRNPGEGMPKYDEQKIPEDQALKLGEYILETY